MLNKTITLLIMLNLSSLTICSEELDCDSISRSGRPQTPTPQALAQSKEQEAASRAYVANYIATAVAIEKAQQRAHAAAEEQERKRLAKVHLVAKLCCISKPDQITRFSFAYNPKLLCIFDVPCCECCCYPRICCTSQENFDYLRQDDPTIYKK